jgi:hypothetical protein
MKFSIGDYTADKTEKVPEGTKLVAVVVVTAWVHWVDGKPIEHRVTYAGQSHPKRDDLPDQDETLWPPGLGDQPEDPKDTRYLHLIDQYPFSGGIDAKHTSHSPVLWSIMLHALRGFGSWISICLLIGTIGKHR